MTLTKFQKIDISTSQTPEEDRFVSYGKIYQEGQPPKPDPALADGTSGTNANSGASRAVQTKTQKYGGQQMTDAAAAKMAQNEGNN